MPSCWFFVIADSKEEAQGLALNYIKHLNEFNERLSPCLKRDIFYSGAVFEYVLPYEYLNSSAINFDQIKTFSVK